MSELNDLIVRATRNLDAAEEVMSSEPVTGWQAIRCLHHIASRDVLDGSLLACNDADPLKRRVGAAVLGQLGHKSIGFRPVFAEERYLGLTYLLATERTHAADATVLRDVCHALGHLHDPRTIPASLELEKHSDAGVRLGVVHALLGHDVPEAIDGLIALSSDEDEDVRDWATFGLGQQIGTDTPAIRAALYARLDDPNLDVRNEAIEGLAKRHDLSVLPALIRELDRQVSMPLLAAAEMLAMPCLCEPLQSAARRGLIVQTEAGPYDLINCWTDAMRACDCTL